VGLGQFVVTADNTMNYGEKYSDAIANGDSSDDKELKEEEDANDDVVDINGSGRYRFGWNLPNNYMVPATHIETGLGHFGTVPRDESPNQLNPGEASGDYGYGTRGYSKGETHDPQGTLEAMGFNDGFSYVTTAKSGQETQTNPNPAGTLFYDMDSRSNAPIGGMAFPLTQTKSGAPDKEYLSGDHQYGWLNGGDYASGYQQSTGNSLMYS